jgi:hypothetical protein
VSLEHVAGLVFKKIQCDSISMGFGAEKAEIKAFNPSSLSPLSAENCGYRLNAAATAATTTATRGTASIAAAG